MGRRLTAFKIDFCNGVIVAPLIYVAPPSDGALPLYTSTKNGPPGRCLQSQSAWRTLFIFATLPKSQACAQNADDQRDDKENDAADLGQLGQLGVHAALTACCHRGGAFAHDRAGQALALLLLREGENNDQHGHGDEDDAENDLIPVH